MLFLHLLNRPNSPAKIGNFYELLLDCFQPLVPVGVGNLGLRVITAVATSVLVVQLLQLGDLGTETGDFVAKHFEVVHTISIASESVRRWSLVSGARKNYDSGNQPESPDPARWEFARLARSWVQLRV